MPKKAHVLIGELAKSQGVKRVKGRNFHEVTATLLSMWEGKTCSSESDIRRALDVALKSGLLVINQNKGVMVGVRTLTQLEISDREKKVRSEKVRAQRARKHRTKPRYRRPQRASKPVAA